MKYEDDLFKIPDIPIDEAYFGKSKELQEIENAISTLRQKYMHKKFGIGLETSDEWKAVQHAFEKAFGIYSLTFWLVRSELPNTATIPLSFSIDGVFEVADKVERNATSGMLKFKKDAKYVGILLITDSLLFNEIFSDKEITAMLLHEMGHQFDVIGYTHIVPFTVVENMLNIINTLYTKPEETITAIIKSTSYTGKGLSYLGKSVQNTTPLLYTIDTYRSVYSIIYGLKAKLGFPLIKLVSSVFGAFLSLLQFPLGTLFLTYSSYSREEFSDKFVAMNGYGPEYTSAISKLDREYNNFGITSIVNQIPLVAHLYQLVSLSFGWFASAMDPHPEYPSRIKSMTNMLKIDLKDNRYDEKTKKQITKDIDNIQAEYDRYIDNKDNLNNYGDDMRTAYYKVLTSISPFTGEIRSALLNKHDTLNRNMNKSIFKIK